MPRLTLTADQLTTLDLALQDRVFVLSHYAGAGPLVTRQIDSCEALRTQLAKPPTKARKHRNSGGNNNAEARVSATVLRSHNE